MKIGELARRWIAGVAMLVSACAAAAAPAPVVLVVGDSLSAEYGLPRDSGWVKLLSDRLTHDGAKYSVVNASISGETTSGGRTRLPALLKQHRPAIVVIELGANDGLRGLPLAAMRGNLAAMVDTSLSSGARVLLVGTRVPPNYGRDYAERYFATFGELARQRKVALAPFLLDGFAERLEYFQADRIHPNENAQPLMLANVWLHLKPLLVARRP
jgi:acyl-CoA thioesterase-1